MSLETRLFRGKHVSPSKDEGESVIIECLSLVLFWGLRSKDKLSMTRPYYPTILSRLRSGFLYFTKEIVFSYYCSGVRGFLLSAGFYNTLS